jgi:transcriptional regulator with XRE-family HTH domain
VTALHTEAYRQFAAGLAEARVRAGLTQRALARKLDVDPSFVAKYETARVRLDVIQFLKIAGVLEIDAPALMARVKGISEVRLVSPRNRDRREAS